MTNIVDIIIEENTMRLDNIAVAEPGREITYRDLINTVTSTAKLLIENGVKKHDRVALYYDDGIDYITLALAVLKSGAVMVPVSPSYAFDDVDPVMKDIDITWLISATEVPGYEKHTVISCSSMNNGGFFIHARSPETVQNHEYFDCNPAFVRFSSGTTGKSKGVVISHNAIVDRTNAANKALNITEEDKVLWLLAMSFHFVVTILLFLRSGARVNICSNDFPNDLINCLNDSNGTFMYASPFHYKYMSESPDFNKEALASLRMAVSTAMSLSASIASSFTARFGLELSQAYGVIEVGLPFIETKAHLDGSVGMIGEDYEINLLDDGEILLRGKGMFSAYFSPWQTLTDLDPEGWFHTGDIGRIDNGFLFIEGRKKEVINFAGMKIFPSEVENVLNGHSSIKESRVYASADETFGQLPVAQIVCTGVFDEKALRKYCYAALPSYKVPKTFEQVASIAKTQSGKIER